MEGFTNKQTDYKQVKKVSEDFWIQNLWEYHDLYVQKDTLLLANVFDSFRKNT